jgi:uncharacterized protein (TIGR00255 family)
MLHSMTGFGKSSITSEIGDTLIEIKSLNSKTFDLNLNTHVFYKSIENEIRSLISSKLRRGKIELKLSLSSDEPTSYLNKNIIENYVKDLKSVVSLDDTELLKIAVKLPEAFTKHSLEISETQKKKILLKIENACLELIKFRIQEGNALESDLLYQISCIENHLSEICNLSTKRKEEIKEKLSNNLNELNIEINNDRFEQELIYYLEKLDINEEIVRLENHLNFFKASIKSKDITKGKKLNFISQEIGREINTIGSKANHSLIQKHVVEMKDSLEKIKEQLLNVL